MKEYKVELIRKKEIARNTLLFRFEKPQGFKFVAGQFGIWTIPQLSPDVEKGNKRYFTIASPPYFKHLEIAMRYTGSPFKKTLKDMKIGSKILLLGPQGSFVLPEKASKPIVFLCGGIGITPARSMILQALHEKAPFSFYLFYSNNTTEDAAFFDEFATLSQPEKFIFVPTMTGLDASDKFWQGERGFIDESMLKRYLADIKKALYYVVGPPGFVEAMQEMLEKAGVEKTNIYLERFVGYNI